MYVLFIDFCNAKNIHISLLTSAPQKEKRSSVTTWIIFSCPFAMYIYDVSVIVLSRDWVSSYRGGKNKIFTHKGSRVRGHSSTLPRPAAGAFYPIQSVRLVISMNRRGLARAAQRTVQPSSMYVPYWATDKQHASEKKSAMMLKDGVAVTWLRDNNGGRHLPTSVIYLFERIKKARGIYLSLVNVITI